MEEIKAKNVVAKVLVEVARVLLGVTFAFSGFVKAVDPYGTAYKIDDYFTAFNLSYFSFLSMPLSVLQSILEFLMGAFMLLGIYRRWNSRLILLTMCFMTPLTLYLAIGNPVSDCGCFGDALVITNWETFYKNLVLLACAIFVVVNCEKITNFYTGKSYWLAFLYMIFITGMFVFYNCLFEPIFDFRPYKVGANIAQLMKVDVGKGRQEETILIYEKDGVKKEFTDQNAPWEDESWEFVDMKTEIISEGEKPIIEDFSISELIFNKERTEVVNHKDITEDVLTDSNYVFLMITPLLSNMSYSYLSDFEDVENYARDSQYKFYCLTASGSDEVVEWMEKNVIDFKFCNTDERTLKTIMRSNPGLLLMKNGVVINKWADISVPSEENLTAPLEELSYGQVVDVEKKDKKNMLYVGILFILPLLLLKAPDLIFFGWRPLKGNTEEEKKEIN